MKIAAIFAWVFAVCATGYTLFHITFQVEALEEQLSQLNRQILKEQEAVHILEAEWSYLNKPSRIEQLSHKYLPELDMLDPAMITDLIGLDILPDRRDDILPSGTITIDKETRPDAVLTSGEAPQ